jgi:ribonuclease III
MAPQPPEPPRGHDEQAAGRLTSGAPEATTYPDLRRALGDPTLEDHLLERALTHRSFAYENGGLPTNERLEFLGDSVLGLIVTETLYNEHPDLSEGRLAKLRAAVVNARALADVARAIGLGAHLKLGRGEEITGGRSKPSILSDTVEAVIGAVYLSGGFAPAAAVVHRLFDPLMRTAAGMGAGLDWKTSLQELCAQLGSGVPEYVISGEGPDHAKTFTARVKVGERLFGLGVGHSKKEAEQQAAESAYTELSASAVGPVEETPVDETTIDGAAADGAAVDSSPRSAEIPTFD